MTTQNQTGLLAPATDIKRSILTDGIMRGATIACIMTLGCIVLGSLFAGFNQGMLLALSLIVAGIAGGILQTVFFNPLVLGLKITCPMRTALFALAYFAVLIGCAYLGDWFPKDNLGAWVSFTVLFLIILAVCIAFFTRIYHKEAADYQAHLERFKAAK